MRSITDVLNHLLYTYKLLIASWVIIVQQRVTILINYGVFQYCEERLRITSSRERDERTISRIGTWDHDLWLRQRSRIWHSTGIQHREVEENYTLYRVIRRVNGFKKNKVLERLLIGNIIRSGITYKWNQLFLLLSIWIILTIWLKGKKLNRNLRKKSKWR